MIQLKNKTRTEGLNNNALALLLSIACILSNLSQLPFFVNAQLTQKINMPIWIVVAGYAAIVCNTNISIKTLKLLGLFIFATIGVLLFSLLTNGYYFQSSILKCTILSLFIYIIGELSGRAISKEAIRTITLSYAYSAAVVALFIYRQYFSDGFNLESRVYAYASKNSISQIIFTSIVIFMFIHTNETKISRFVHVSCIIFETLMIMILRSRATIVGFLLCVLFIVYKKDFNRKIRRILLFSIGITAIVILLSDRAWNVLINNILLASRDSANMDSLTSGRASIIASFPERIEGHWLTGIGSCYFECFPLSCLLQFGFIIGGAFLVIAYTPLIESIKLEQKDEYLSTLLVICIGYSINSIFEGLAPIGPGVKCYFMWLLFGLISAYSNTSKNDTKEGGKVIE